ncbi:hypothetical protein ACW73L_18820 [Methylolobus aquaticus]
MANILHLFWRPDPEPGFVRAGEFRLWLETEQPVKRRSGTADFHPRHLDSGSLSAWLAEIGDFPVGAPHFEPQALVLPSANGSPLASPELRDLGEDDPVPSWESWQVDCYRLTERPIQAINDLHFRLIFQNDATRAGRDFLFWYWFTQSLRHLLLRDQYLPAIRYRTPSTGKDRYDVYAGWEFAPDDFEALIADSVPRMPGSAAPGFDAESALRHCAEVVSRRVVTLARPTQALQKKLDDTPLAPACRPARDSLWLTTDTLEPGKQWATWRRRVIGGEGRRSFQLGLQLHEPDAANPDHWALECRAIARADPPARRALGGRLSAGGRFPPIDSHCPARSPDYARLSGSLTNVSDRTVRDRECDGRSAVVATIRIMLATPGSSYPVTRMRHSKVCWAIIGA